MQHAATSDQLAPDRETVEIYDFFGALRARKYLVAGMAVLSCLLATGTAFLMTPVYRSKATLYPQTSDVNPLTAGLMSSSLSALGGSLAAISGGITEADRETDEAITVLQSREFAEKFIEDHHLLPVLFPELWDAQGGRWKEGVKAPTLSRAFVVFEKIRKIDVDENNDFITIQIDWTDRIQAADWANDMVRMLNEQLRARSLSAADASLGYLREELPRTSDVDTQQAISRLIESQLNQKVLATVTPEFELRFVTRAMPADADRPVFPNKIMAASVGLVFGALVGVAAVLILYRRELVRKGQLWTGPGGA